MVSCYYYFLKIDNCCKLRMVFTSILVHEPKMWDNLKGQFMNHIEEVNADLKAAGRPPLGSELNQQ
jgi:hypothetical protein